MPRARSTSRTRSGLVHRASLHVANLPQTITGLNLQYLLAPVLANGRFYRYQGSLTTPGCSEVVSWVVAKQTIRISRKQARGAPTISARMLLPWDDILFPVY